jgi:hypothetical protein
MLNNYIRRIANYLKHHKSDLPILYYWDFRSEILLRNKIISKKEIDKLKNLDPYKKVLYIRDYRRRKFRRLLSDYFDRVC